MLYHIVLRDAVVIIVSRYHLCVMCTCVLYEGIRSAVLTLKTEYTAHSNVRCVVEWVNECMYV